MASREEPRITRRYRNPRSPNAATDVGSSKGMLLSVAFSHEEICRNGVCGRLEPHVFAILRLFGVNGLDVGIRHWAKFSPDRLSVWVAHVSLHG